MTHKLPKNRRQPHLHARGTKTMNKTHYTGDEASPFHGTLILNEGAGRGRTLTQFPPRLTEAMPSWANNRAGYNLSSLPVVGGEWVGLHTGPCGCKLQGRDRVKNKASGSLANRQHIFLVMSLQMWGSIPGRQLSARSHPPPMALHVIW